MKRFDELKEGDHAYTIWRPRGREAYAVLERLSGPGGGKYLRTLPCYSDGMPMLYFSSLWRRRSGIEVKLPQHGKRRPRRLVLELPEGVRVAANPRPDDLLTPLRWKREADTPIGGNGAAA